MIRSTSFQRIGRHYYHRKTSGCTLGYENTTFTIAVVVLAAPTARVSGTKRSLGRQTSSSVASEKDIKSMLQLSPTLSPSRPSSCALQQT